MGAGPVQGPSVRRDKACVETRLVRVQGVSGAGERAKTRRGRGLDPDWDWDGDRDGTQVETERDWKTGRWRGKRQMGLEAGGGAAGGGDAGTTGGRREPPVRHAL